MPPNMHWALVLVLAWITGGIFGLIWFFNQAGYVKKIDPTSRARKFLVLYLLCILAVIAAVILSAAGAAMMESASLAMVGSVVSFLGSIAAMVFALAAVFGMRRSMIDYFNTVEPIGLRLSGVMTFFFNMLYFQYHMSRIAQWKQTGTLR
jgi:hypothetical protein